MALALALSTFALAGGAFAQPRFAAPEPLPILAWIGPPADQTTPERYRELADAGFNASFSGFPDLAAMERALDVAGGAGVKLMASCPELRADPEAAAARLKGHPALAGYFLTDEPGADAFDELGDWARRLRAADPGHPCYVNLLPTYASPAQLGTATYAEHLDKFLEKFPASFLTFDHYPILGDKLRVDWHENLALVSAAARRAGIPFWAFALSVAHAPYRVATVDNLRLQVYTDLAFGARAIEYFTYWTPVTTQWNFNTAPIETDGRRTEVYDRVKQVNAELQAVWPVFAGAEVVRVSFAGPDVPRGLTAWTPEPPVAALETAGGSALVSRLRNGEWEVLAVVATELKKSLDLKLKFADPGGGGDSGSGAVYQMAKDGKFAPLAALEFADSVAPGDMRILIWGKVGKK